MSKSYDITVKGAAVWVRMGPSLDSKPIKLVYKGQKLHATERKGSWFKHNEGGWSCFYDNGHPILIIDNELDEDSNNVVTQVSNQPINKINSKDGRNGSSSDVSPDAVARKNPIYKAYQENGVGDSEFIKNCRGIHALPYQYMSNVDMRLPGSKFGCTYAEKIIDRMPLLILSPGKPKFMKDYTDEEKKGVLKDLVGSAVGVADNLINSKDGKLYSFEYNYNDYYKYVNSMCSKMSRFLGVHNCTIYGSSAKTFDWKSFANSSFRNFTSAEECIAFYIDSETQISESFSNNTGESLLANKVNETSDMGQELQYLLGGMSGATGKHFDKLKAENYDKTLEEFNKFTSKYNSLLPGNLMDTINGGLINIISGGKMMFPEIWKDSEFSRSYDISIKLKTPDCDNLSWFLNIGVPLAHLIALTAPQQMGHNGYRSPFLVRGYYKGFFNCDMGIITNMSINKGDKGRWTLNGLPTEVEVNLSIKDLYHVLMISLYDSSILESFSNTAMMDYIGNLCGINMCKPDLRRSIDMFFMEVENKFTRLITFNKFTGVRQSISNLANTLYGR